MRAWFLKWGIDLLLGTSLIALVWFASKYGCIFQHLVEKPDTLTFADFLKICSDNLGFAPASFVSITVGLNIAIAKWEAFSRTLTDMQKQLDDVLPAEIKRSKLASALADDSGQTRLRLSEITREPLENYGMVTEAIWNGARRWAVFFSITGIIFVFFRWSGGAWAILFLAPTALTWASARVSRLAVSRMVRGKIKILDQLEEADRKIEAARMAAEVNAALDK